MQQSSLSPTEPAMRETLPPPPPYTTTGGKPSTSRPTSRSQLLLGVRTNYQSQEDKHDGDKAEIGENKGAEEVRVTALSPAQMDVEGSPGSGDADPEHNHHQGRRHQVLSSWFDRNRGRLGFLWDRNFYVVLVLGQVLALGITATNTFTSLLSAHETSIPAFQSFFNYVLLNLVYTPFTLYRYGFKRWARLVWRDGWKYIIFAFFDVEGNYFVVLAYNYTTMLSAQLINFWAIAVVVIISFLLLRVRYHWFQLAGILVCIGGMGILFGSDHITGSSSSGSGGFSPGSQVKGDLFALLGATFYGLANVSEEFVVSVRPMYEALGQLGLYGLIINGTQAAIFDRNSLRAAIAHWHSSPSSSHAVAGYLVGYTLCLFAFYSAVPIMFRLSSAAFFNISLLTANFWGVIVGVRVFHLHIHWMYPIAFVCIIVGQVVYFVGRQIFADEAFKPWLGGRDQERGVVGIGTAKRSTTTTSQHQDQNQEQDQDLEHPDSPAPSQNAPPRDGHRNQGGAARVELDSHV